MDNKKKLSSIVGLGILGLTILGGCSDLLTKTVPSKSSRAEITYQPYVDKINSKAKEQAEKALEDKSAYDLRASIELYLSVRNLEQAEKYASKLIDIDSYSGLRAYRDLQEYRNDYREELKNTEKAAKKE
jgi:hypothetical protein